MSGELEIIDWKCHNCDFVGPTEKALLDHQSCNQGGRRVGCLVGKKAMGSSILGSILGERSTPEVMDDIHATCKAFKHAMSKTVSSKIIHCPERKSVNLPQFGYLYGEVKGIVTKLLHHRPTGILTAILIDQRSLKTEQQETKFSQASRWA